MSRVYGLRRSAEQRGATAVEYGLLIALIAGVIIGSVLLLSQWLAGAYVIDFTP